MWSRREQFMSWLFWSYVQISLSHSRTLSSTCPFLRAHLAPPSFHTLLTMFLFSWKIFLRLEKSYYSLKPCSSTNYSSVPPSLCSAPFLPWIPQIEFITPISWFPHHSTLFLRPIQLLSRCTTVKWMRLSPYRLWAGRRGGLVSSIFCLPCI